MQALFYALKLFNRGQSYKLNTLNYNNENIFINQLTPFAKNTCPVMHGIAAHSYPLL